MSGTAQSGATSLGWLRDLQLPFLIVDGEGRIEDSNAATARLLGLDERSVVGTLLVSFAAPGGRRALRRLVLRGEPSQLDVDLETPGGERIPVRVHAARDGDRVLLAIGDRRVEERSLARAAALERRADRTDARRSPADDDAPVAGDSWVRLRLGRLVDSLPQGVLGVDRRLRVTDANRAAVEILEGAAVRGRRLPHDWHGFDLGAFARSLFSEQALSAEAGVTTGAGRIIRLIGMASDDRRLAVILADDASAQSRREQAERDFVANAAHELQSPIAAVVSAVEALELGAKEEPENRDRFLRHLSREAHRMQSLVGALLQLARVQQGEHDLVFEPVELRPFLESLAGSIRPASGVGVQVLCPPELSVETSPELLGHAVGNAVANAMRFTRSGTIRLSAHAVRGDVVIEVGDSGPGIPIEQRGRVVERFYRARPSGEGAGLGLAIAWQAVEAIGGKLSLHEAPEGGALVRIVLPADGERA